MVCATVASAALLAIPLCVRYITTNLLTVGSEDALHHIYILYKVEIMGALMERDMRSELFEHYQRLSFKFYDDHKTGQLMTRISRVTSGQSCPFSPAFGPK